MPPTQTLIFNKMFDAVLDLGIPNEDMGLGSEEMLPRVAQYVGGPGYGWASEFNEVLGQASSVE